MTSIVANAKMLVNNARLVDHISKEQILNVTLDWPSFLNPLNFPNDKTIISI